MPYITEKVGKRHTNIFDAETGEYVCQLRNNEVGAWLHRAARSEENDKAHAIARRGYRLENVRAYLARRATRPAPAVQLDLF
jgi:hypothetical protein